MGLVESNMEDNGDSIDEVSSSRVESEEVMNDEHANDAEEVDAVEAVKDWRDVILREAVSVFTGT